MFRCTAYSLKVWQNLCLYSLESQSIVQVQVLLLLLGVSRKLPNSWQSHASAHTMLDDNMSAMRRASWDPQPPFLHMLLHQAGMGQCSLENEDHLASWLGWLSILVVWGSPKHPEASHHAFYATLILISWTVWRWCHTQGLCKAALQSSSGNHERMVDLEIVLELSTATRLCVRVQALPYSSPFSLCNHGVKPESSATTMFVVNLCIIIYAFLSII